MNQKLLIVLFSTILYNGVTYSSPVEEHISDAKLSEEKLSKVLSVTDESKKKKEPVEPAPVVTSADHLISVTQNATSAPQHSEISTNIMRSTTLIPSPMGKISTLKSSTEIITNGSQDSVMQNVSKIADTKTYSQAIENKNAISSDDVSAFKKNSASSSANPYSTSAPLTSTVASTITATVNTTIKSTISTMQPTSTLAAKAVTGQNTPAPAEESHFDGPSFIGGIVLTIGLTAIGFIAFKYYKSGKIDMNYRTL